MKLIVQIFLFIYDLEQGSLGTGGGFWVVTGGPGRRGPRGAVEMVRVGDGPGGWGPEGVWAPKGGAQNFALFFPSPATFFFGFSFSRGSFRRI